MLTMKDVWAAAQGFGGVSIPYNPVSDTGIYEVILPDTDHKRQCCIVVTDNDMVPVNAQVVRIMASISERRYRVCSKEKLNEVLARL